MGIEADKIIIALDFEEKSSALALVQQLSDFNCHFKVGKEMFTRFGPAFVETLIKNGASVFLDLKFHDIPNTVYKACYAASELGVWMLNVHALGGMEMMQAAKSAVVKSNTHLIAVTVLTSLNDNLLQQMGFNQSVDTVALNLAKLTHEAGLSGVVASAIDANNIKTNTAEDFLVVSPGIRLTETSHDDQKRIMTPKAAIDNGSDYLVIGRPITKATNPVQIMTNIIT